MKKNLLQLTLIWSMFTIFLIPLPADAQSGDCDRTPKTLNFGDAVCEATYTNAGAFSVAKLDEAIDPGEPRIIYIKVNNNACCGEILVNPKSGPNCYDLRINGPSGPGINFTEIGYASIACDISLLSCNLSEKDEAIVSCGHDHNNDGVLDVGHRITALGYQNEIDGSSYWYYRVTSNEDNCPAFPSISHFTFALLDDAECCVVTTVDVPEDETTLVCSEPDGKSFTEWLEEFNVNFGTGNPTITYIVNGDKVDNLDNVKAPDDCGGEVFIEIIVEGDCAESEPFSSSSHFSVPYDTEAPMIGSPGKDGTVECPGKPVFTPPTAIDNCDPNPTVSEVSNVTTPGACAGTYVQTVCWQAVDHCGNKSETVCQTIEVIDTQAPTIGDPGADDTIECPAKPSFTPPTASDTCDPDPTVSEVSNVTTPGACAGTYVQKVCWQAEDCSGNTSQVVCQTIKVIDSGAPTIGEPGADATIECPGQPEFTPPLAEDNCDPKPTVSVVSISRADGTCPGTYVQQVCWQAEDCSGNKSEKVCQTITVVDKQAPTIGKPGADVTIECPGEPEFTPPLAKDECDPDPIVGVVSNDTEAGNCPGTYVQTVCWQAKDCSGNLSEKVCQTITVVDKQAPTLGKPGADVTIECPDKPVFTPPTAIDNCDPNPKVSEIENHFKYGDCPGIYALTTCWRAIDCSGNLSEKVCQTITVVDTQAPKIGQPGADDNTLTCGAEMVFTPPTASDTCDPDPDVIEVSDVTTPGDCPGNYSRTKCWKAVDCDGNESATVCQTLTINDCSTVEVLKLTQGAVDPSKNWTFNLYAGPDGFGGPVLASQSTLNDGDGILDGFGKLSAQATYTICELEIAAGWTAVFEVDTDGDGVADLIVPTYNPNEDDDVPSDIGNRCYDFSVSAFYQDPNNRPCALNFSINNTYPGGDPRTPGYWKNWNTCSNGNQVQTAAKNGGPDEGFFLLDDILNYPGIYLCNLAVKTCEDGVAILDQRDLKDGRKRSNDAAYTLAMHLLAAKLNFSAGAEMCQAAMDAVAQGDQLLCQINYNGRGAYLRPKDALYSYALCIAATLDTYNNGNLCPDGGFNCGFQASARTDNGFNIADQEDFLSWRNAEVLVYPNPSVSDVTIEFTLPQQSSNVTLDIYSMTGKLVKRIFDSAVEEGVQTTLIIQGKTMAYGTYIYRLNTDQGTYNGKFILME